MFILERDRSVFLTVLSKEIVLSKGCDYYVYYPTTCKITLDVPQLEIIIEEVCKEFKEGVKNGN